MNNSNRVRRMVVAGVLAAITFVLGLTPIGYIPLPAMKITIIAIPVIIGVITEGLAVGLLLGFIFGLTSFIQILMGDALGLYLLNLSIFKTLVVVFIPRLIVPITTYFTYQGILKLKTRLSNKLGYAISAVVGTLTNTILFLSMMYIVFLSEIEAMAAAFSTTREGLAGVIATIGLTNGIPEAIAAMIIVTSVCIALEKIRPRLDKK